MKKTWGLTFAVVVTVQLSGFYILERYLAPASFDSFNSAATASGQMPEKQIQPPTDASLYDIDRKGTRIAIYDQDLITVKDRQDQIVAEAELKGVHFLQWLDAGDTLFYVRKIDGKNEIGVYKVPSDKIVPLHDLASTKVTIEKVLYSSYSQMIFIMYQQDKQLRLASYEAIFGWKSRPLNFQPEDIRLDEKTAALRIEDQNGKIWTFKREDFADVPSKTTIGKTEAGKQEVPAVIGK
jgi:hypothetical protein